MKYFVFMDKSCCNGRNPDSTIRDAKRRIINIIKAGLSAGVRYNDRTWTIAEDGGNVVFQLKSIDDERYWRF